MQINENKWMLNQKAISENMSTQCDNLVRQTSNEGWLIANGLGFLNDVNCQMKNMKFSMIQQAIIMISKFNKNFPIQKVLPFVSEVTSISRS